MSLTFQVLPVHPSPEPGESLTSYLTRLADSNGISSVNGLSQVAKISLAHQSRQPDVPVYSYQTLAEITAQDQVRIQNLTFYPLMVNFRRGDEEQRAGSFLRDAISSHLRFCPVCVAEKAYYQLSWRFRVLEGCPVHNCQLTEYCPHCNQPVRIFGQVFRIGVCTACGGNLIDAPILSLDNDREQKNHQIYNELQFVLTPQPQLIEAVFPKLGPWLAFSRKEAGLKANDIAKHIGCTSEIIKAMESSELSSPRGEKFIHYWRYARLLGTDLANLFNSLADLVQENVDPGPWNRTQLYEKSLLVKAKGAAAVLAQSGEIVTQTGIARIVGVTVPTLRYYPRLRSFLEAFADADYLAALHDEREQELIAQVTIAIKQLRQSNELITKAAIGRIIRRAPEGFRAYPRVVNLIEKELDDPVEITIQREQELYDFVQSAVEQLKARDELITQAAVARIVGLTPEALKRYPRIQSVMKEIAGNFEAYNRQRENEHLIAVRRAAAQLQVEGRPIEQETIAEMVGLQVNSLKHYPSVRRLLSNLTREHREENVKLRSAAREQLLIDRIKQAAQDLHVDGLPVTRANILKRIGTSSRTMSRYQGAREVMGEVIAFFN